MHLRLSSVTRHGKTYQYAQLVESIRRKQDGMPAHRVIANLGRISDPVQLENLKAALTLIAPASAWPRSCQTRPTRLDRALACAYRTHNCATSMSLSWSLYSNSSG